MRYSPAGMKRSNSLMNAGIRPIISPSMAKIGRRFTITLNRLLTALIRGSRLIVGVAIFHTLVTHIWVEPLISVWLPCSDPYTDLSELSVQTIPNQQITLVGSQPLAQHSFKPSIVHSPLYGAV